MSLAAEKAGEASASIGTRTSYSNLDRCFRSEESFVRKEIAYGG